MPATASDGAALDTRRRAAKMAAPARAIRKPVVRTVLPVRAVSESTRVLADSRDNQSSAVHAPDDRRDVECEYRDPAEHQKQTEHASQAQCRHADDARDEDVGEEHDELRN